MSKQDIEYGIALVVSLILSAVIAIGGQTIVENNINAGIAKAVSVKA